MSIFRKIQFVVLMIVTAQFSLVAQNSTDFFVDSTQHLSVSFGANYTYGSSVMNNEFLNNFVWGGRIEREDKDKAYQNLSANNKLGGDLKYQFNVAIPLDSIFGKKNISFQVGLEIIEHMDAKFSSDLFSTMEIPLK